MGLFDTPAGTFLSALGVCLAVALIARLSGARPRWTLMLGIAAGVTLGEQINTRFMLATVWHPPVLGACVGVCSLLAQAIAARSVRKA